MNVLQFIELFTLLVIVSAFFCNGWYAITRGFKYQYPDGKITIDGELLKGWQVFWEAEAPPKKVYFNAYNLELRHLELEEADPSLASKLLAKHGTLVQNDAITAEDWLRAERLMRLKLQKIGALVYMAYVEYPQCRFPAWVSKPLSSCVKCYSSIYGSAIWWAFVFLQKDAFGWAENKIVAYFVFWVIFTIVLSFLNVVLSKKIK